jgi:transposase
MVFAPQLGICKIGNLPVPRTGRPKNALILTEQEALTLQAMARRPKSAQRLALRARIVLECAKGKDSKDVAAQLDVCETTVGKWRRRFLKLRLVGLEDTPRPGAPRSVQDEKIAQVIADTLEKTPKGATQWSTRSMAAHARVSQSAVSRIWRAFGLKPHLSETFKLSTDPQFVDKVRDVVGLYMNPPEKALVISVDEKSQIQALERSQPVLPLSPGLPERRTHDYMRHGTTSLFAALDIATGKVINSCKARHRHQEFLAFLKQIEREVPDGVEIHLVLDNYATHKAPAVKKWLLRRPHWHLHFTPTGASWLNQVERFFAIITDKCIRRGTFRSVRELECSIKKFLDAHNENPKPFQWTATAEMILEKVAGFNKRINDSVH